MLLARISRRGTSGLSLSDIVAETGWLPPLVQQLATGLHRASKILIAENHYLSTTDFTQAVAKALTRVEQFHQANPLVAGINKEQLREALSLRPEIFRAVLDAGVRDKKLELAGELVRRAGRGVVLRDDEAESKQKIEAAFARAGLQVPALKEVLASLKIDQARAHKIVTLLLRDHVLVKLSDDLVFHRSALETLRQQIVSQKSKTPKLNVAAFKDLFGLTRKYAIPLLEYLDREHITKRVGDERVIL